jgi:crotonobetainyl-CoA:carnitine CoA-transferase CaiB-like acyl-CoA transferase
LELGCSLFILSLIYKEKDDKMLGPLSSLKVLDFSTLLPGPFATMMLADMGAEVLRVNPIQKEGPGGEKNDFHFSEYLGRSKRSLSLDLKKAEAITIIHHLVEHYDIVVEQFRPGVMARLGIDYESLRKVNPKIIYCSLTGYGQTGPYKERAGHDINYLAISGVSSYTGTLESGPILPGVQIADIGGGSLHTIIGLLAAVIHRQQTGEGQHVDISMTDGAFSMNSIHAVKALQEDSSPTFESTLLNGGSFYDYYETKDGRYFSVGSLEPKFFEQLSEALEKPEIFYGESPLFHQNQGPLKKELSGIFKEKTFSEWCKIFSKFDACVEPVLNLTEALEHPQIKSREMVVEVPKGDGTFQKQIGNPLIFSSTKTNYKHIGVPSGLHTEEILLEIGLNKEEIMSLKEKKIIG